MQDRQRGFLYFICAVSAMGGLLFGYDWVVIGGAKPFYELFFSISDSPFLQGLAMSTALLGCLVGAMVAGTAADRYGRKPLLTTAAVLFTVSAVATGLFNDFTLFNIARFIGGVGIGVASALSPMYIAEVSPAHIRGRMVSLNQMTIVLGILAAQIVNMLLARDTGVAENQTWNVAWGWRWMFWAETLPAALFLVLSFFIPESPVYMKMRAVTKTQHTEQKAGLKELMQSKYGKVLLLGLVIAVFQQWCGTNVIFNYAQEIFVGAGFDVDGMFINIVITGIANVIFTIVALYTIEKWGRRTLILLGAGGLGIIYLTLGTCYFLEVKGVLMVVLVVTAISVYAMTLGPVTWTLLAEIFPNRIRGIAMATCTFALWVGCCTLTFSFPSMNAALGSSGTFWIYSAICLCAFIFLFRRCPETKGKSLEQLEQELVNNNGANKSTMRISTIILLLLLTVVKTTSATERYASPSGTDPEGLSVNMPGSLRTMVERLEPGDTLYLMDGQYDQTLTLVINKRATADKWITICAAQGAKPIIDFRQQPNGTNGIKVTGEYIHIKDLTIRYAGKKGIWLENSSHCILERLDAYGCCDSGIQLRKGGYNVVVNCDSHDNFDYQDKGSNADGFADKQGGAAFPGNTYIACRAWNNSDDGWDSFQRQTKDTPTVYMYCVTYNNGPAEFDLSSHPRATGIDRELPCMEGKDLNHFPNRGNPNGFKFGGQGKDNKESGIYTRHDTEASHCLAVGHRSKGFDQNNNAGRMTVSHCLAYRNDINYGFGNPYPCTLDIRYCISVEPVSGEHLATAPETTVIQEGNSWNGNDNGNVNLGDIDIVRVMLADRQANGSLPEDLLEILKKL